MVRRLAEVVIGVIFHVERRRRLVGIAALRPVAEGQMVLHVFFLELHPLIELDPERPDEIHGPFLRHLALLHIRFIIRPQVLVDPSERRIGQRTVQQHMHEPAALQRFMEGLGRVHRNLAADPANLQKLRFARLVPLFLGFLSRELGIASRNIAGSFQAVARRF